MRIIKLYMNKNKYYIYKRTNLINGMIYIGQTTKDPKIRWNGENSSNQEIGKAIREFGKENFKDEIIDYASNREELNKKEIYWIKYYNSTDPSIGYNRKIGGHCLTIPHAKKRYVSITDKLIFNFKKDLINFLGPAKASYLGRPYYLDYNNTTSPIWGIMTLQEFEKLQEQGKINFSLKDFSVYTTSGQ